MKVMTDMIKILVFSTQSWPVRYEAAAHTLITSDNIFIIKKVYNFN